MTRLVVVPFAALALLFGTSANSSARTLVASTSATGSAVVPSIDGQWLLVASAGGIRRQQNRTVVPYPGDTRKRQETGEIRN
jgi:hypothetical protein